MGSWKIKIPLLICIWLLIAGCMGCGSTRADELSERLFNAGQKACGASAEAVDERTDSMKNTSDTSVSRAVDTDAVILDSAIDTILGASANFLCGYPIDDSFLCWFYGAYGAQALGDVAAAAALDAPDAWYAACGNTMHVLWLDYCKSVGVRSEELMRVTKQVCATSEETVLSFTGDMNFDDTTGTMQHLKQTGLSGAFSEDLLDLMAQSDILMINNECTYSTRGEPIEGKAFTFRSDPKNVSILQELGVDIAGIANNHVCDYGYEALTDTIETLDKAGIPYVGAGHDLKEAKKPWYFVANGRKIAIVAATQIERTYNYTKEATDTSPGVLKTLNPDKFIEVIEDAKKHSDIVIAFVHWGTEGTNYYEADQVELAERFVSAGADVIIGGHTHCLQGVSYVEDVPVIYSLGNFWFGSTPTDGVTKKDTALAQVFIRADGSIAFRIVPCVQENLCTTLVTDPAEKERILTFIRSLSGGVSIDADGYVQKAG